MQRIVLINVDAAAVSLSPLYISAKFNALDAAGIAAMTYRATKTYPSTGTSREIKNITPKDSSGEIISFTNVAR